MKVGVNVMEMKTRSNFIEKYFKYESKFSNLLFKIVLAIVIAQQIYLPQKLKYFHLAMLFGYMIFTDFLKDDYRTFKEEYIFLTTILSCSIISIIEGIAHVDLGMLYLLILSIGIMLTFRLIFMIFNKIRQNSTFEFTKENQHMLEKGNGFIKVLLLTVMVTLVVSSIYVGYEMIIRL